MDDTGKYHRALSLQLLQQYQNEGNPEILDEAIDAGQICLVRTPEGHADKSARSSDLAAMFGQRYQLNRVPGDLTNAIKFASDAVVSAPKGCLSEPAFLSNLGSYYGMRYEDADGEPDQDDLEKALELSLLAVNLALENDPNMPSYLDTVATQYERRSALDRTESTKADAQLSVQFGERALQVASHDDPNRAIFLNNMGNHFQALYDQDNNEDHLVEAIKYSRLAILAIDNENPMYLPFKNNLGIELERLYDHGGGQDFLHEAIQSAKEVASLSEESDDSDPKLPDYLNTLSVKIADLYNREGQIEDLEEAINLTRRALKIAPETHPDRADWLNNIGNMLESLFRRTGKTDHIVESVATAEQAVQLARTRGDHPDTLGYIINLSNNIETRFEATGDILDLDTALQYAEEVVNSSEKNDTRRSALLKGLGTKFIHRYELKGDMNDLEEGIRYAREALSLVSENQRVYATYLSNLAIALGICFQRTHAPEVLDEAIMLSRKAVKLTEKSEQDYVAWQINLTGYLAARYDQNRPDAKKDLEEAIDLARTTVDLTKGEHMDREPSRENLAALLFKKSKKNPKSGDLEESIRLTQQVLDATGENGLYWSAYTRNMGIRLMSLYETSENPENLESALQKFLSVSKSLQAAPLGRIEAIRAAIRILQMKQDWKQASELASNALQLLPLVCGRYLSLQDQQYVLSQTTGLAADSCSLSLKMNRTEEALLRLEQGRGVMIGYMMESRSDISALKSDCPALAKRYEALRYKASRKIETKEVTARQVFLKERREAIAHMEELVAEIRRSTVHTMFLLEPGIEELKKASSEGPIVMVNVTDISSDALIITTEEILAMELPKFFDQTAPASLKQRIKSYQTSSRGGRDRDVENDTQGPPPPDRLNLAWLWNNCVKLILNKLEASSMTSESAPPRVWWIGTGVASSLPFHAAGAAFVDSTENTLSHIMPSYAQSIKALKYSRSRPLQSPGQETTKFSILLVTMSTTPGQLPLPGVEDETASIKKACQSSSLYSVKVLPQPAAEEVLRELSGTDIVHFACHSFSDPADASSSHLLLQKPGETGFVIDQLKLSQISEVVTEGKSRLAFLSACSTAEVRAGKLADEGLHLANVFQVAGFGQVIGALWSANDEVSARLAELFYVDVVKSGQALDHPGLGAFALRTAIMQVRREYPESPELWAPFIHLGV